MPNTATTQITNVFANPPVLNDVHTWHGRLRVKRASVATLVGDAIGHFYVLFRVKAHDVPFQLWVMNTADGGMTDVNAGIFNPPAGNDYTNDPTDANGATSRDVLFDGQSQVAAQPLLQRLGVGPNAVPAANIGAQRFWEIAGITALNEPAQGTEFDICLVPGGNPAGGQDMTAYLYYTAGD